MWYIFSDLSQINELRYIKPGIKANDYKVVIEVSIKGRYLASTYMTLEVKVGDVLQSCF